MATMIEAPDDDREPLGTMTVEEFLALPDDDGVDRWLLRGKLMGSNRPMSRRSFLHSRTESKTAHVLLRWLDEQPAPHGAVVSGEAGFRLSRQPASTVGVDVAYASAEQVAATPLNASLVEGAPLLAVEVISPSEEASDISDKIEAYLMAGTALVWRVEPALKIITVFRSGAAPQLFTVHDEITAEPHLPGFRARVAEIFS